MAKVYRLVVFDWEGTLHDTLGQVLHIVAAEAQRLQLGEFNDALARQWVSLGLDKTIKKVYPALTPEQHVHLLQAVQQSLMYHHSEVYLMKGAMALIQCLYRKGVALAIATNKGQQSLHKALQLSDLSQYFKVTRSAGQTLAKPAPQMLEEILETLSISAEDALMVGDSQNDIEMARSVGMDAIGMNFYYQPAERLLAAGALVVFDDYQLLADFLHCGS